MTPWQVDANFIDEGQADALNSIAQPVGNDDITSFLASSIVDRRTILVAPKGYGKTLLLKTKSFSYRKAHPGGTFFFPKDKACERLQAGGSQAFIHENLRHFSSLNTWTEIWSICLTTLVLKLAELPIRNESHQQRCDG